jgi:flagellar biosynthetic protein FliR
MLDQINTPLVFTYMLVFCRIGSGIMLLPGISEGYISPLARLVAALGISLVILPIIQNTLPAMPADAFTLILMFAGEVLIGVLIGTIAKILLSSMHVAGSIISYQIGLSSATMFDPSQGTQGTTIGTFLTMLAIMLIFATDMHHIFIKGLVDSYTLFSPARSIDTNNMVQLVNETVAGSFSMGLKLSAPQIIISLIISLSAGIMGRIMPQMQVFFVMMPIQIALGFFILMVTLSASMMWFMDYYTEIMGNFINISG